MAQSSRDQRGLSNADGWGIGYYVGGQPVVEKCHTAAYDDTQFAEAATRISSPSVLAHVRKATVGRISADNTHPFSTGAWCFAHNGTLTAFDRLAGRLESEIEPDLRGTRRGTTDSELIFLWILSRMKEAGIRMDEASLESEPLESVFVESVRLLAARDDRVASGESAKLNLLLTDGRTLIASRWGNTLYRLSREGVHDCEICGLPHVEEDSAADFRSVLVASEPLTSEAWIEIPERSVVVVDRDVGISTQPIS